MWHQAIILKVIPRLVSFPVRSVSESFSELYQVHVAVHGTVTGICCHKGETLLVHSAEDYRRKDSGAIPYPDCIRRSTYRAKLELSAKPSHSLPTRDNAALMYTPPAANRSFVSPLIAYAVPNHRSSSDRQLNLLFRSRTTLRTISGR